jgi:hypothetical protein
MSCYCHWCDSLVAGIVTEKDEQANVIWIGCRSCYLRRVAKHAAIKKQI